MLVQSTANKRLDHEALNMRKLQLMLVQYRYIYSKSMCILFLETSCLYNSIDSIRKGISIFAGLNFLYLWCGFAFALNVVLIFGTLANVHQNSKRIIGALKAKPEFGKSKWFNKWVRSFPVLRVYMGGTNYLETLTPLVMESFVVSQTVS